MNDEMTRAQQVFRAAAELDSDVARRAYVQAQCGGDDALRREVEGLLAGDTDPAAIERSEHSTVTHAHSPAPDGAAPASSASLSAGQVLAGRFTLRKKLGEGGMGEVWAAQQSAPVQREVALKVIRTGLDSARMLARFEQERQALALMDHPNIAKVLDAGIDQLGRPYFVMELINGVPLNRFCDDAKLPPRERLELFITVCQAVQHAHQKGVIHRDLKPSNILTTVYDGQPTPKVIDFGVAKATGPELANQGVQTEVGSLIGTLEYMSPEQAELSNLDIDTRSDVYALGVVLYQLLTGSVPFTRQQLQAGSFAEMLRIIQEVTPSKPSTRMGDSGTAPQVALVRRTEPRRLATMLRGDLDWIVMKCLEKDRARRYATANDLAADLRRYLASEPVLASPPSVGYRVTKFVRRNRGPVVAAVLCLLLLIGGVVGTSIGLFRTKAALITADRANQEAQAKEAETRATLEFVESQIFAAARPKGQEGGVGRDVTLREALEAALPFVEDGFRDQPLVEARLRMTIGKSFRYLGEFEQASVQFRRARAIFESAYGTRHSATLDSMNYQAITHFSLSEHAEALALFEQTLAERTALLGPRHPDTLESMNNVSNSYDIMDRAEEAFDLRQETFDLRREVLGIDHAGTLTTMMNLAGSYAQRGDLETAEKMYEENYARRKKVLGPDHPDTLSTMYSMAYIYTQRGDLETAEKMYKENYARRKKVLGPDHSDTLSTMYKLAQMKVELNQLPEALALFEEFVPLQDKTTRRLHNNTLSSLNEMGRLYAKLGQVDRELALFEDLVDRFAEKFGQDGDPTLQAKVNLAQCYHRLGRHEEALKMNLESLEAERVRLGRDEPLPGVVMGNVAISYGYLGRHTDALPLHLKIYEHRRETLGEEHRLTLQCLTVVGMTYNLLNQPAKALEVFGQAVRQQRAALPPNDNDTLQTLRFLATAYYNQQRYPETIRVRRELLESQTAKFGATNPATISTANGLAWMLATAPEAADRDPATALELADRATAERPTAATYWGTRGTALYRLGQWEAATKDLEKAIALREPDSSNNASDAYFAAMSCWQLGQQDQARQWFEKAQQWQALSKDVDPELIRFRAEAAALLGVEGAAAEEPPADPTPAADPTPSGEASQERTTPRPAPLAPTLPGGATMNNFSIGSPMSAV